MGAYSRFPECHRAILCVQVRSRLLGTFELPAIAG